MPENDKSTFSPSSQKLYKHNLNLNYVRTFHILLQRTTKPDNKGKNKTKDKAT
jgi:hypothetical protein